MSIRNLFYWSYWFQQPYIARDLVLWIWLVGFLGLVLAGLVVLFIKPYRLDNAEQRLLGRFSSCFLTMGILGLVWFFFRQERVVFLAWRFWLLIWFAVLLVWLVKNIRYAVKRLPQIKAEHATRAAQEKYLPGQK